MREGTGELTDLDAGAVLQANLTASFIESTTSFLNAHGICDDSAPAGQPSVRLAELRGARQADLFPPGRSYPDSCTCNAYFEHILSTYQASDQNQQLPTSSVQSTSSSPRSLPKVTAPSVPASWRVSDYFDFTSAISASGVVTNTWVCRHPSCAPPQPLRGRRLGVYSAISRDNTANIKKRAYEHTYKHQGEAAVASERHDSPVAERARVQVCVTFCISDGPKVTPWYTATRISAFRVFTTLLRRPP